MRKMNKNAQNTYDDINNTIRFLKDRDIVYYFIPSELKDNNSVITWSNHISGRFNCGEYFNTLKQYEYIIKNGAYQCIFFDGSIIRTTFNFNGSKLVSHSHLWWPAPYTLPQGTRSFMDEVDEENKDNFLYPYNMFLQSSNWFELIRMRSPIRVDYDSCHEDTTNHPLVHMHIQNDKTRLNIKEPISFYTFIKFIIDNFYPNINFDYNRQPLKYQSDVSRKRVDYKFSSIAI